MIYYTGEGVPKDIQKSIYYLSNSANQNDSGAQLYLGNIFLNGEGIPKNIPRALHYYSISANLNNSEAQFILGNIYHKGKIVLKDIGKAIHYYSLSANQNNSSAQHHLGIIYYYGDDVIRNSNNIKKGIHYFLMAANQNNRYSQNILGQIYLRGLYVPKDIRKAIHYFLLSADNGNHISELYAGIYYQLYEENNEKAIHYYKKASNFNNYEAKNNLGVLLMKKAEKTANESKSIHLYGLAIQYFEEAILGPNFCAEINLLQIYNYYNEVQNFKLHQKVIELTKQYFNKNENEIEQSLEEIMQIETDKYFLFLKIRPVSSIYNFEYCIYDLKDIQKETKIYYNVEQNCDSEFYVGLNGQTP